MNSVAIRFEKVKKIYYLYANVGFKELLLHPLRYRKEKRKRALLAVRDVSFEIKRGESFGFMGPNGSGKSTILSLIAGVLKPDGGSILVNGRVAPLLELGAGFHHELTGRENIMLNSIILGMTKKEAEKKTEKIIEFSELGEFIDQPIRTYSSGMLARLGFSVAIHVEPEILLVDEILAVGDENFQKKCLDKMLSFKKNGVTIVFVSHNIEQVEKICDRVARLDKGSIVSIDELD